MMLNIYTKVLYALLILFVLLLFPGGFNVALMGGRLSFHPATAGAPGWTNQQLAMFTVFPAIFVVGILYDLRRRSEVGKLVRHADWTHTPARRVGPPPGYGLEGLICFADTQARKSKRFVPIRTSNTLSGTYEGQAFIACDVTTYRKDFLGRVVCLVAQPVLPRFDLRLETALGNLATVLPHAPEVPSRLELGYRDFGERVILRAAPEAAGFFDERRHRIVEYLVELAPYERHLVFGGGGRVFYTVSPHQKAEDLLLQLGATLRAARLFSEG